MSAETSPGCPSVEPVNLDVPEAALVEQNKAETAQQERLAAQEARATLELAMDGFLQYLQRLERWGSGPQTAPE